MPFNYYVIGLLVKERRYVIYGWLLLVLVDNRLRLDRCEILLWLTLQFVHGKLLTIGGIIYNVLFKEIVFHTGFLSFMCCAGTPERNDTRGNQLYMYIYDGVYVCKLDVFMFDNSRCCLHDFRHNTSDKSLFI